MKSLNVQNLNKYLLVILPAIFAVLLISSQIMQINVLNKAMPLKVEKTNSEKRNLHLTLQADREQNWEPRPIFMDEILEDELVPEKTNGLSKFWMDCGFQ